MRLRVLKMVRILALICVAVIPLTQVIQAQDSTKREAKASANYSPSKWDFFVGYSFLLQEGEAGGETPRGGGPLFSTEYKNNRIGSTESLSYYFNNHFGWQVDSGQHDRYINTGGANTGYSNSGILSIQSGPVWRWPSRFGERITPFIHGMAGVAQVHGPDHQPYTWGPTFTGGAGVDLQTNYRRLSIRMIQADYEYIHTSFPAPACLNGTSGGGCIYSPGGHTNMSAGRLSAGLVFHFGAIAPPPPITIGCSASPASVFPGDPVTATATAGGLDPKLNAVYSWSGSGVTGNGTTASVATADLAPGSYTVNCGVKEGKAGKEGLKPWQVASSSATFTVKAFEPPTVSCTSNPRTIKPGETSTITSMGMSPQNRPLTYSYSAGSGSITGSGTSAVFSSTGAPTGSTAITCNVSDDKGQTATAGTNVEITAPYVAPVPHTQALCSINFTNDKKRPTRVDNEAKACLDDVALGLQKQSDAKAVVVGDSTTEEKTPPKHARKKAKLENVAGQRAVNTKEYLVTEKGIDASRIGVATGVSDSQKVENYLVPSGASFTEDVSGTAPVDESVVKPQVRKPLAERHHASKHAKHHAQSVKPSTKH